MGPAGAQAGAPMSERQQIEAALAEIADRFVEYEFDPLGFVMWAFPWGVLASLAQAAQTAPLDGHLSRLPHLTSGQ